MLLKSLVLRNFRNYEKLEVEFSPGINFIYGLNGEGKTNLLEAIYFLSTGRSFKAHQLSEMIRKGSQFFYVEATFIKEGLTQTLKIGYEEASKKIEYNATSLHAFTDLLGILPSVLYSPRDIFLISGSPQDRRRFINLHLAQMDPVYVYHLIRYTRALKQRNALLKKHLETSITCFEEELALSGAYLMQKRHEGLLTLSEKSQPLALELSENKDHSFISYEPSAVFNQLDLKRHLMQQLMKTRKKDLLLGTTLIGPHRDDFCIKHNHEDAKHYSSEGQKRTFITALKLAEWSIMQTSHDKRPLMLIDDFGIHLDGSRLKLLHHKLYKLGQVILTSPFESPSGSIHIDKLFYLKDNTIH